MAIKYLNNVDLNKNQLQNPVIHPLGTAPGSPAQGQMYFNSTDKKLYFYDNTSWIDASGDIKSITSSTTDTLTVANGTGPNPALTIVTAAVANGGAALANGDQIYDFVDGFVNNAKLLSLLSALESSSGAADETISIGTDSGDTVSFGGNVTVTGNLTVSGTTTTINSNTVNIGDNILVLNSDATGSPSADAGIEIERGSSTNTLIKWNESTDRWTFTNDGSNYFNIPLSTEYASGAAASTSAAGLVELATSAEALAGSDTARAVTPSGLAARSFVGTIGDGSATSITVTHSLNSRDVIVQLYDASSYETVYADITRATVDTLTVAFSTAPASNDIKVLVTKID